MTAIASIGSVTAETRPMAMSADALLQASRRIDWRFLLPDPNLGDVAYLGKETDSQFQSLRLFARSATLFASATDAQFDGIVVGRGPLPSIGDLANRLRPNGWLYIEAHGWLSKQRWSARARSISLRKAVSAPLKSATFRSVETFWHWPDFERTAKILPLVDHRAIRRALGPELGATALRQLTRFPTLLPCVSVLAQRG